MDLNTIKRPQPSYPIPESAKAVFVGKRYTVFQWPQKMFDGSTATFERVRRMDSVNIIPITPEGKIVITKQEQPASPSFIGLLGGLIDEGETPFAAAQRELKEEAALVSENWQLWFAEQIINGIDWAVYTFIARQVRVQGEQQLDVGEKIELQHLDLKDFLTATESKKFRDTEVSLKVAILRQNEQKRQAFEKLLFG